MFHGILDAVQDQWDVIEDPHFHSRLVAVSIVPFGVFDGVRKVGRGVRLLCFHLVNGDPMKYVIPAKLALSIGSTQLGVKRSAR